jgi:transketolase
VRQAFCRALVELAGEDSRILLLTGDLGYTVLEPFAEQFPDRYVNVGVAEQNMVGLATGLAEAGFLPFVYSAATFASLRPYEFVRNGPILHGLPVRIVGVGGGFEYGTAGPTHYGLEDLGVMRLQPGITVVAPADHRQARNAILATWDRPGPIYYRLGKDDATTVPGLDGRFRLGRVEIIAEGPDVLFASLGAITREVTDAAGFLATGGVRATIAVASSLNPAPADDLAALLARFRLALVVEAHYAAGGFGSLVAEVIAERGLPCRLVRCGVRSTPSGSVGGPAYLHREHGLSSDLLARAARDGLEALDRWGCARL